MNRNTLYVANLPAGADADQLVALLAGYGAVTSIEVLPPTEQSVPAAKVTMAVEKAATRALTELNGFELEGQRLAICYVEADPTRELTSKQRATAEQVAAELGESEKIPVRQIHMMVRLCGPAFATALVAEAKEIDAGDGLMTKDGSRRRSLGGVFFELAAARMSPAARESVVKRKGKMPATSR